MRIVFMGTPEFAVPSLWKLVESTHEVACVVTAPDRPAGRGLKVQPTPVKRAAMAYRIPTLQPTDLTDPEFIDALERFSAQIFVVVAFRILPPEVFTMPPFGTINLHPSLLPRYRGAAPINWAIINGEKETGVTTIFIEQKVDAGQIIQQRRVVIGPDETAGELHDRLAMIGAEVLLESINMIESGKAPRTAQTGEVTRAPKLTREICKIRWENSAESIRNLVRGLSPKPGAHTYLKGKVIKIFRCAVGESSKTRRRPGEVLSVDARRGAIRVATGSGTLEILELQLEGKRRMSAAEFLRGHALEAGEKFG